jgi:preprotein translocase subunit SecA
VNTPSQDYARTTFRNPSKLHKGIDSLVDSLIGRYRRRAGLVEQLRQEADRIDALAREFKDLTEAHLQEKLHTYRDYYRRGGRGQDEVLHPALAAIREASDRRLGLRPFNVQLMGALALYRGYLAEMATGEGKTLTAGVAAVLFGWSRKPCHIITVNDYLVQRDAEWLRALYSFAGVKEGFVTASMQPEERRKGYACDVTYTTSKEVVADFLRDGLHVRSLRNSTRRLIRRMLAPAQAAQDGLVMRGLHTAIVDEADSILIDEAVTPLIISTAQKNEALQEVVQLASQIAEPLEPDRDYRVNRRYREIELTDEGQARLESRCSSLPGIWRGPGRRSELIKQALSAREFYQPGRQYVIADGKIVIVDEFTGRPMPQRTWRQGMHQAIEAKEQLKISDPSETLSRLSFQRYFRFYHRLAGMTGTAREAAAEFWQIYHLPVVTIPTHKPCVRVEHPDRVFGDEASKWEAIVEEVLRVHATGRPVLIGTRSVSASEKLGDLLTGRVIHFRLLNAVRHQEEAQIISDAGEPGRITIATNMAGRGTDIKLGFGMADRGGLHVIATERHESRRVDRQLFGRSARQGDPGSSQAFFSVEDELFRRFLPKIVRERFTGREQGELKASKGARLALALAQRTAQREAFKQRRNVLKMDDWLEESLSFAGGTV